MQLEIEHTTGEQLYTLENQEKFKEETYTKTKYNLQFS
jgi:hypothetical protein